MTPRLRLATLGVLSSYWLKVVYSILTILETNQNIFPKPTISESKIAELLVSSLLLLAYIIKQAITEYKKDSKIGLDVKKVVPFLLVASISAPIVFGYVYDHDIQSIGQMIIDLGTAVMDEDFDTTPPGEDPPGWEEDSGDWYTVDDGGNNVYYQNDDGDKEALSISTTGNTSWTDYSFLVDLKFDTGPSNKQDRGALLVYRFTGGNEYYFLAMREARDELEIYKHGTAGAGHFVGSASCVLEPGVWYSVNVTIRGDFVWVSVDDTTYFSEQAMQGANSNGSVGIGTEYYKVMFDNILVELR